METVSLTVDAVTLAVLAVVAGMVQAGRDADAASSSTGSGGRT